MFLLTKPDEKSIRQFLATQKRSSFSYAEIGATRNSQAPATYLLDHNRVQLGQGQEVYRQATDAIRHWKMFDFVWITLCFDDTPIESGQTVAILVRHFGFWSLNAARIVYVLHETNKTIEKFGFAYGTLTEHAESGKNAFLSSITKQTKVFGMIYMLFRSRITFGPDWVIRQAATYRNNLPLRQKWQCKEL